MDTRSQSDSDGGGGHPGWSPVESRHDEGSATDAGSSGRDVPVLSLDQIRITGSCNEYTDGPAPAQRSPAVQHRQQKNDLTSSVGTRSGEQQDERPNNLHNLHFSTNTREGVGEPLGSARNSTGSSEHIIRTQPKRSEPNPEELKSLTHQPREEASAAAHHNKCEDCGRCRCGECRRPRTLPSCWLCGRRCVCSAQNAVEYGSCVCCVKALFYHCSSDDEETCADKPFSCSQSHCCVRWTAVSLLAVLFPCLLCYVPAKGCVAACQSCYDRVTRPGCRYEHANLNPIRCEGVAKPT